MYGALGEDYINKGQHLPSQNKSLACKEQLRELKTTRLDSSIALDSCIGQELAGPRA